MSRYTQFLVGVVLLAMVVGGTGGFSSTTAQRNTDITVAENSVLAVETPSRTTNMTANRSLLTITNRRAGPIELTVVDESPGSPAIAGRSRVLRTTLAAGETRTVTARVHCSADGVGTVSLRIIARTASTTVEQTRSVPVDC